MKIQLVGKEIAQRYLQRIRHRFDQTVESATDQIDLGTVLSQLVNQFPYAGGNRARMGLEEFANLPLRWFDNVQASLQGLLEGHTAAHGFFGSVNAYQSA